jgi:hypothetical protein
MKLKAITAAFVGMLLVGSNQMPVRADSLIKAQVTCYCEPGATCTGSTKKDKIIASKREWLGYVAVVYKVDEDGEVGEYIGTFPIDDIGYGAPMTGSGLSSEFEGRDCAGTVETGLTFDFSKPTNAACVEFMKGTFTGGGTTGSEVYIKVVKGVG